MMNSKCCDYDNNDYPTATYCGKCGKWLAPKGWTMLAGSPTRTFQIHDDINLTDLNLTTDDVHPDEKSFLLAFGDVVCFSMNHECVAAKIDDLAARFLMPSMRVSEEPLTPVFVRPYLCVVTTGQIAMWRTEGRNVQIINDNRIIPIPHCAPLGIDKPTSKAVICGFKNFVFVLDIQMREQAHARFNQRFIPIEGLEKEDILKTPVLWEEDDLVVFITAKGKLLQLNLRDLPDRLTPKANVCAFSKDAILSSPCLYEDSLFFESLITSSGAHQLHRFNLRATTDLTPALLLPDDSPGGGDMFWDEQHFQFAPHINSITQQVIVSSKDLRGFVCTDINSWKERFIASNDGSLYRHWFSLAVNQYLLTVSSRNGSRRLQKLDISSNEIHVVWEADYDISEMVAPPVWHNNALFLLTSGQLSKWKWGLPDL
jgi:hypothetical protein